MAVPSQQRCLGIKRNRKQHSRRSCKRDQAIELGAITVNENGAKQMYLLNLKPKTGITLISAAAGHVVELDWSRLLQLATDAITQPA